MIQIINITSPRTPYYWKDFPKDTKHLMNLNIWIAIPYNMGLLAVIVKYDEYRQMNGYKYDHQKVGSNCTIPAPIKLKLHFCWPDII